MSRDLERLRDMLEAIECIEEHAHDRQRVDAERLIQTWMIHHIQIIGEAARQISETFRGQHPEIPWPQIIGMRNILVHNYFGVDPDEVWAVVENDIPDLKAKVLPLLAQSELG